MPACVLVLGACERPAPPQTTPVGKTSHDVMLEAIDETAWIEAAHRDVMSPFTMDALVAGPLPRDGVEGELAYLAALEDGGVFDATAAYDPASTPITRPQMQFMEKTGYGPLANSDARRLARAQRARLRVAAVAGEGDRVVMIAREVLAHAHGASKRLAFEDRTAAMGMQVSMLLEISCLLHEGLLDERTCARLLETIDRAGMADLGQYIQETHAGLTAPGYHDWRTARADADDLQMLLVDVLKRVESPARAVPSFRGDSGQYEHVGYVHKLALSADSMRRLRIEGTRLMLAVEIHRHRQGTYPASLDALTPGVLREIPLDPISGRPFGYVRFGSPDGSGRAYLVYSIGYDLQDNGGREDAWMRLETLRGDPAAAGLDYVVNEVRNPDPPDARDLEWPG